LLSDLRYQCCSILNPIHFSVQFLGIDISDGYANLNGDADHSAGCDDKSSGNKSSTDESVDVFSDSISTDYEFLNSVLNSSSDDDDTFSDCDKSDNGSLIEELIGPSGYVGTLHLHDPPIYATVHCPPFAAIDKTLHGECDCNDFGMIGCAQTDDFQFYPMMRLSEEYDLSSNSADSVDRLTSATLRRRLYQLLLHASDLGIVGEDERRTIPNCVVAGIRQIYPSATGGYTDYVEKEEGEEKEEKEQCV
jgi:hypothetical protein